VQVLGIDANKIRKNTRVLPPNRTVGQLPCPFVDKLFNEFSKWRSLVQKNGKGRTNGIKLPKSPKYPIVKIIIKPQNSTLNS